MTGRGQDRKGKKKGRKRLLYNTKAVLYSRFSSVQFASPSLARKEHHAAGGWQGGQGGGRPGWERMWVADQVGRGATGKRVGLVDCASSIRDKGCRVSQDAQEPPFPTQTANPRPIPAQGPSQGDPFLALLPSSLSPSPGRKEVLLRAAAVLYCVQSGSVGVSERASSPAPPAPGWGWLELFFSSTVSLPPVSPRRRPLLFPSLHRESLTVSPPNRLVAESTDSLPSSPFLPSPLLYVLTTVTPLKSPLCAFPANSRSPVQSFRASHLHSFG